MHVPFEGPGLITRWIDEQGHQLNYTRFFKSDPLPDPDAIDLLIIMGGPMNVNDRQVHAWLRDEIGWVTGFIKTGKPAIGICLGAQIIATALGSEVYQGKDKEIGWHDIRFLPPFENHPVFREIPHVIKVFHWHGDTFHIPEGATRVAASSLFPNQGFIYRDRLAALQFHLEVTPESVKDLVENCREELVPGPYIQDEEKLLDKTMFTDISRKLLFQILDHLAGYSPGAPVR
jgi:GMP synthase (glutamine-hydrolysing)